MIADPGLDGRSRRVVAGSLRVAAQMTNLRRAHLQPRHKLQVSEKKPFRSSECSQSDKRRGGCTIICGTYTIPSSDKLNSIASKSFPSNNKCQAVNSGDVTRIHSASPQ